MATVRKRIRLSLLIIVAMLPVMANAIDTPSNVRGTVTAPGTVNWEWSAVEGAREYRVTVNGSFAGTTPSLEWNSTDLWVGDHSMTVAALDESGQNSSQSQTVIVVIQAEAVSETSQSNAAAAPNTRAEDDTGLIDPSSYDYPEVREKAGYELVFSDEFNADSLNPARWHSQLRWDGEWNGERYEYRVINGEDQFYINVLSPDEEHQQKILGVANPFEFDGSRLAIRARVNPLKSSNSEKTHGALMEIAEQQTFVSGAISTHEKFSRKYGYFEASIKIPSHEGTFPAFWLFHERRAWEGTQRTEIDIMENLGHAPEYIYNSFHYFKNVSEYYGGDATFVKPKPSGQVYTGIDYSQDFHVYAVEWSPGNIKWFIDGELVSELDNAEADFEELYVMINLAMGGNWTNFPTNAGGLGRPGDQRFPTDNDVNQFGNPALEIDYVRVYGRR